MPCVSRIASATSRIDLRLFIESRWMRWNASDSFKPAVSISTPFARSTILRVLSASLVSPSSLSSRRNSP